MRGLNTDVPMIDNQRYPHLARIETPADLRQFPESELGAAAWDHRVTTTRLAKLRQLLASDPQWEGSES